MMKKIIIILLVALLSLAGYSQIKRNTTPTKPKTEKAEKAATKKEKKKSSSKSSAKKGTKKTVKAGKKKSGRNRNQESYGQTVEREDPYLYLNDGDELNIQDVPQEGASYKFDISSNCEAISPTYYADSVDSDGESFLVELDDDPDWFSFGYNDEVGNYVTIDANDTYSTRRCVVVLTTEEGPEATINISQEGKPVRVSGSITSAYIKHNQEYTLNYRSEKCMEINANVTLHQGEGLTLALLALFKDEDGNVVRTSSGYSDYSLFQDGKILLVEKITPTSSYYNNTIKIVLPNEAMFLYSNKKQKLTLDLIVYCFEKGEGIANYRVDLVAKGKKGKLVTDDD